MKEVNDYALISDEMFNPCLFTGKRIALSIGLSHLYIGLLQLPVEIFTEEIKDRVYALLRVVLPIALELLSVFTKDSLEHSGSHYRVVLVPHFIKKFGIGLNKTSTGTQGITFIDIVFESFIQEIFR